jgi:hypothetical protein
MIADLGFELDQPAAINSNYFQSVISSTPATIARKRGLTFESQVSDTVQQVILQVV